MNAGLIDVKFELDADCKVVKNPKTVKTDLKLQVFYPDIKCKCNKKKFCTSLLIS